ncbi:MAG: maleylpyruvate isomerase family mycothiol-dependent enzyme [Acidimicrobiia bacterium]
MPHHLDYAAVIERESTRFLDCLGRVVPEAAVPACPGWSAADLLWHLAEVQHFWGTIVRNRLQDPEQVKPRERPGPFLELLELFRASSRGLLNALGTAEREEDVWTWSDDHTVGFVLRRQAHEALIHRVDAELVSDEVTPADPDLALDGIDELLRVMLGGMPAWGSFQPDGLVVGVEATDAPGRWTLRLGRFQGTSPNSGKTYDFDAAEVGNGPEGTHALLGGEAWLLDRWLWGRAGDQSPSVAGDESLARRLRALAVEATQ